MLLAYCMIGFVWASFLARHGNNPLFVVNTTFDFLWTVFFWPTHPAYEAFVWCRRHIGVGFLDFYIKWLKR